MGGDFASCRSLTCIPGGRRRWPGGSPGHYVRFHRSIKSGTLGLTETPKNQDTAQSFQRTLQVGHCLIASGPADLSVGGMYENGKKSGFWTRNEGGATWRFQSRGKPCYLKSKQPYVEGKRHGTGWEVDPYTCKCFELTWENDERVSREKVGKRTCRREIDWSAGTPWGSR